MAEYFEVLNSIINKSHVEKEDISKHFVPFIAIRWLGSSARSCYDANALNSARGLKYIPKELEYTFLKEVIKLPKYTRLQFDKIDKEHFIIISFIMKEFKCGENVAIEYMDIMGGQRILKILYKYAHIGGNTHDPEILDLRKAIIKKEEYIKNIKGLI